MPLLELWLLGPFQATLNGAPLLDFQSNKVRALLAYLAVEGPHPHHRIKVATLLWPHMDDASALRNLRSAIADLRRRLGDAQADPPFLRVSRYTVELHPDADVRVDALAFREHLAAAGRAPSEEATIAAWQAALSLYTGEFLQGFQVRDSPPWEEWLLLRREEFERGAIRALRGLAQVFKQRRQYERARAFVRQWLEHTPWDEDAHCLLMQLLALDGRRGAALAQYERCRELLADNLGVEPAAPTRELAQAIREGRFPPLATFPTSPRPRQGETPPSAPPLVARDEEMTRLTGFLHRALDGHSQVAFITGPPGSGKSALAARFGQNALAAHGEIVVVWGESDAIAGQGDPYLPFRDILLALSGSPTAIHLGMAIGQDYARRLYRFAPVAIPLLIRAGPGLLLPFGLIPALRAQAEAFLPQGTSTRQLLDELRAHEHMAASTASSASPSQNLTQFSQVLEQMAAHAPLLLILDDLQWADVGSVTLLFHLARRLHNSPVLVLGMFRSEDVLSHPPTSQAEGIGEGEHPLAAVVHEVQRQRGDVVLDLGRKRGDVFVNAYLDTEPNRLDEDFRRQLVRYTGGNPLFTIETLRMLEARGFIAKDADGCWRRSDALVWDQMPPRVEAVIAERVAHLPARWEEVMRVASVLGETFSAEVVADVLEWPVSEVVHILSALVAPPRHLVEMLGHVWVGRSMSTRYRFRHALFRRYLYDRLAPGERAVWHAKVAAILEAASGSQGDDLSLALAHHFEAAARYLKAAHYYHRAGERAMQRSAPAEALRLYTQALTLLRQAPPSAEREALERTLNLAMNGPLIMVRGWGAPERAEITRRAYDLCLQSSDEGTFIRALALQTDTLRARGQLSMSLDVGRQLLPLAERYDRPAELVLTHTTLGESYFFMGELARARHHFHQALASYAALEENLTPFTVVDQGVLCHTWLAWVHQRLGAPERGERSAHRAVALARRLDDPLSLLFALSLGVCGFYWLQAAPALALPFGDELVSLMHREAAAVVHPWGHVFHGWLMVEQGRVPEGIEEIETGMEMWQGMGAVCGRTCQVLVLAQAYARAGDVSRAQALVREGLALAERTGERVMVDLLCHMGEILK